MTHVADLVLETTTTLGVGTLSLLGPEPGYFSFVESFADGDQIFYTRRQQGGARQVCKGTLHYGTPPTLTVDAVYRSSVPGNAPVDWAGGVCMVFPCLPAEQVLLLENALSEIADFLIAGNELSEVGATTLGLALLRAASAAAARTSLGLGSMATLAAGTAAGNGVQLDGSGKLPAVPGDLLTSLPSHSHSALIGSFTGGSNSTIVRYNSPGTVTAASKADTPAQLQFLMARGSDGLLYLPGSIVPFTGVTGGQRYYLGLAGALLTAEVTPDAGLPATQVIIGYGLNTGVLGFRPERPVGGNLGSAVALKLEAGDLKV